jgi:hypothetical protein
MLTVLLQILMLWTGIPHITCNVKEYIISLRGPKKQCISPVQPKAGTTFCVLSIISTLIDLKNYFIHFNGIHESQIEVCHHCGRRILRGWLSQPDNWTWQVTSIDSMRSNYSC